MLIAICFSVTWNVTDETLKHFASAVISSTKAKPVAKSYLDRICSARINSGTETNVRPPAPSESAQCVQLSIGCEATQHHDETYWQARQTCFTGDFGSPVRKYLLRRPCERSLPAMSGAGQGSPDLPS